MASQLRSRFDSALALICLCAAGLWACDKPQEQARPRAEKPAQVRCEDFITKADVTALGLGAEPYREMPDPKTHGARCAFGDLTAVIWPGDKFGSLVDGIKQHGKGAGIVTDEGPPIGSETHWTSRAGETGGGDRYTVNFVPMNRKFTASVTGTDKATVEQIATTLLDRLQRK